MLPQGPAFAADGKRTSRSAQAAAIAASAMIALALVDGLLAIFGPLSGSDEIFTNRRGEVGRGIDSDLSVLQSSFLFGQVSAEADAFEAIGEDLKETTLKLTLVGPTAVLEGEGVPSAVISVPGENQKLVRVDEEIIPGVMLKRIEETRVVISRQGSSETLSLKQRPDRDSSGIKVLEASLPVAKPDVAEPSDGQPVHVAEFVEQMPWIASFLEAEGVASSDRVVAVAGRDLPSSTDAIGLLLNEISGQSSVTVTFVRGDQEFERTVPVAALLGQ
ncbi:MAG: type II secretion system protein N [Pseudomonadota bacterium]